METDKVENALSERSLSRRGFAKSLGAAVLGTTVGAPLIGAAQAEAAEATEGLDPTAVKTSAYTAAPGDYVPVNIENGSVAIKLPSAPLGTTRIGVQVVAVSGTPGSTTVTINRGGSDVFNIAGGSTSLTLSAKFQSVLLQYHAGIWYVQSTDTPLNQALGSAQLGKDATVGGEGGSALSSSLVNRRGVPAYFIRATGANAEAISGVNGEVVAAGENHAKVFQEVVNELKGKYGQIAFSDRFTFTEPITVYAGMALVGAGPLNAFESMNSAIYGAAGMEAPVITLAVDPAHAAHTSFPYLANFAIIATEGTAGQHGIEISKSKGELLDVFIDKVLVFHAGGHGIYNNWCSKVWLDGVYVEDGKESGIRVAGGILRVTNAYIDGNKLFGIDATSATQVIATANLIRNNIGGGLLVWSTQIDPLIVGNEFDENGGPAAPCVVVNDTSAAASSGLIIANNNFLDRRGVGACNYFISGSVKGLVHGTITGNRYYGQKEALPIKITPRSGNRYIIKNNQGFNDTAGRVATPFAKAEGCLGIEGTEASPAASTEYRGGATDLYITSTGGAGVSITIKDPAGNVIESGLPTLAAKMLPVGYLIGFGAFSEAPTVHAYVM